MKHFPYPLLLIVIVFVFLSGSSIAQSLDMPIGVWRHHLPNRIVVSIAETPDKVYGATPYGILEFNKQDNSIRKFDKVNGLSDFGITVIRYHEQKKLLLVAYQNGTLDVLQDGHIFSIPDIRLANIFGSKRINSIYFTDDRAYLSCDFGIIVLDLNMYVILDTWFIGPDGSLLGVYDLVNMDGFFYAATAAGILRAPSSVNLADYRSWVRLSEFPQPWARINHLVEHHGKLLANYSGSGSDTLYVLRNNMWEVFNPFGTSGYFRTKRQIRSENNFLVISSSRGLDFFDEELKYAGTISSYTGNIANPMDAFVGTSGTYWIGDQALGLVFGTPAQGFESILLSGPPTNESFRIVHNQSTLWVAPGSIIGGWQNTWNDRGVFIFNEGKWNSYSRWVIPSINIVRDVHQITPHIHNPNRAFASAWSGGLVEFDKDEGLINWYNETNSTLQLRGSVQDIIRIGGSAWDSRANLWVSNSDADHFLSVKKPDGQWMSYPHNGLVSGNETVGPLVVDNFDQKWVSLPRGGGIIVFKEESVDNNNSFQIRKLTGQPDNGNLPNTVVSALARDKDGYIWVGTADGMVVFYAPQQVFRGVPFNAQPVIVVQDGYPARLFENETVNTIFIDGSNKKWVGTRSSGAFLLSADTRETLMHFTRNNSPLPSDNILSISVDPQSGEVFFATDQGLVSYRAFATEGHQQHTNVYTFPNPVRPGYNGYIAVKGLVTNARVKITDINGNLIHDAFAEGGQLVWNGKDLSGQRPSSGVYLVFSTNPDGTETIVTKILFLK